MTTISLSAPLESRWDMSLPMRQEERVVCVCVRVCVSVMHMHAHMHKGAVCVCVCVCVCVWLFFCAFSATVSSDSFRDSVDESTCTEAVAL